MIKNTFVKMMAVALVALVLGGCGAGNTFEGKSDLEKVEGVLTRQSSADSRPGTHILTTEDGEETLIRSTMINLSSSEYLGNLVQAVGVFSDENVFEATGISVLDKLVDEDSESNFVTYKNTDLGFQIKYYDDWEVEVAGSSVIFTAPLKDGQEIPDQIIIDQESFAYEELKDDAGEEETPLDIYFKKNMPAISIEPSMEREIGPDGIDAVRLEEAGEIRFYAYRKGLIYVITLDPADGAADTILKNIFNEIVGEFRLIGFTVESDSDDEEETDDSEDADEIEVSTDMELSTYESSALNFVGSYPADWYYAGTKSKEPGVVRHYGFGDESVEDDNEIVSLDILSGDLPSGGQKVTLKGHEAIKDKSGELSLVYVKVEGRVYRFSANSKYNDLLEVMAASIEPIAPIE